MGDRRSAVLSDGSIGWEYQYRVARCNRDTQASPEVFRSPDGSRAEFRNVYTCGSVWHCPVCAPKVAARRRDELSAALAVWSQAGGDVWLLTYTHSHARDDRTLAEQDALLRKAYSRLTGSRAYRSIMERAFAAGAIRATEVTHGQFNGWHPHIHVLLFTAPGQGAALKRIRKLWVRVLLKVGLHTIRRGATRVERLRKVREMMRHAFDMRPGQYAAEYVAKFGDEPATRSGRWGLGSEVTQGHTKRGADRLNGRTPMRLLADAADGDRQAWALFREYAIVMHGRRQLYWSPGLRARLIALAESARQPDLFANRRWLMLLTRVDDDEVIAAQADRRCTERVGVISLDDWRVVLSRRGRGLVLECARWATAAELRAVIDILRERPPDELAEFVAEEAFWRKAA